MHTSKSVIFICTYTSPEMAANFVKVIKQKFSKLNFTLVVVNPGMRVDHPFINNNYTYRDINFNNWNIEHVRVFYAYEYDQTTHASQGWWSQEEWRKIFVSLGLLY